jgi:hypothetical protein
MTEAEAQAIDMIWDGPRNNRGQRLWGGLTRGTTFSLLTASFTGPLGIFPSFVSYWMEQNPTFDILGTINTSNFSTYFEAASRKFADTEPPPAGFVVPASTDSIDLSGMVAHGTKMIHYRGTSDPLALPFGSWNYDSRLLEKYGVSNLGQFYRSFYFPGNGHCGGGLSLPNSPSTGFINGGNFPNAGMGNFGDLFNALIDWVENKNAPSSITAYTAAPYTVGTTNSTLICAYPAYTSYKGTGPISAATSYACVTLQSEKPELAGYDEIAQQYHEAP